MQVRILRLILFGFLVSSLFFSSINSSVFANTSLDVSILFKQAYKHLENGELRQAVDIYDEILTVSPGNTEAMLMKGIVLSDLDRHKESMKEFYKVLEKDPNNISAMVGMGVGFGNFGEYKEAKKYFEDAYKIMPNNHVVINYQDFAKRVVDKYPYNEVEKPEFFEIQLVEQIPVWVKNNAGWWADGKIADSEFLAGIQFLIKNSIIKINNIEKNHDTTENVPVWVKNNAGWWADGKIADSEFLAGIYFLIENGLLVINIPEMEELTDEEIKIADRNRWQFARYLDRIEKTVNDDRRYIEYPNPSGDVIKKFLRDYSVWNFEQQIQMGNKNFPNPVYTMIDGVYHLEYKIYINKQPSGLPLDHVSTLGNSFQYWEDIDDLKANDGKPVKVYFTTTQSKIDSNLWVTWVVRDIGENVLGHANLGKGVIEVALGGYGCDGSFQLFNVDTVEIIMTHELGHGIGLRHSTDQDSIMYPTIKETNYAYCLLDIPKLQ